LGTKTNIAASSGKSFSYHLLALLVACLLRRTGGKGAKSPPLPFSLDVSVSIFFPFFSLVIAVPWEMDGLCRYFTEGVRRAVYGFMYCFPYEELLRGCWASALVDVILFWEHSALAGFFYGKVLSL